MPAPSIAFADSLAQQTSTDKLRTFYQPQALVGPVPVHNGKSRWMEIEQPSPGFIHANDQSLRIPVRLRLSKRI